MWTWTLKLYNHCNMVMVDGQMECLRLVMDFHEKYRIIMVAECLA